MDPTMAGLNALSCSPKQKDDGLEAGLFVDYVLFTILPISAVLVYPFVSILSLPSEASARTFDGLSGLPWFLWRQHQGLKSFRGHTTWDC